MTANDEIRATTFSEKRKAIYNYKEGSPLYPCEDIIMTIVYTPKDIALILRDQNL